MESPDVFVLSRVDWQFWCTFTFKREVPNRVQWSMFRAWVRGLERIASVKPKRLLWLCRRECGEIGSRRHLHALVGGLPGWVVTPNRCWHLMYCWRALGGGHTQIHLYERALAGVSYALKNLERDGAQQYEARKFGDKSSAVMLSEGLVATLSHRMSALKGGQSR